MALPFYSIYIGPYRVASSWADTRQSTSSFEFILERHVPAGVEAGGILGHLCLFLANEAFVSIDAQKKRNATYIFISRN